MHSHLIFLTLFSDCDVPTILDKLVSSGYTVKAPDSSYHSQIGGFDSHTLLPLTIFSDRKLKAQLLLDKVSELLSEYCISIVVLGADKFGWESTTLSSNVVDITPQLRQRTGLKLIKTEQDESDV